MAGPSTETVGSRQQGMDTWPTEELVEFLLEGQLAAVAALQAILPDLSAAVEAMATRLDQGGRLIYAGAGASGRIAIQDGIELKPTYSWPADRIHYLLAGGEAALTQSVEGAEDDAAEGQAQVDALSPSPSDILIAVAASGTTPYTIGCAQAARKAGALVIAVASNPEAPLLKEANHPLLTATGAEPVGGSTRMKAGTAQKIVLNILSTAAMVRLGRVFDGYMIDVVPANAKLVDRSARIVADITDVPVEEAVRLLQETGGIKPAILMAKGLSANEAAQALAESDGNLRRAMARQQGST